ncbi:MAG TPA: lysyl oxidase family protein [Solirubrobacterales bacterium]|nr:lysyl oxidase family protein [Solirubrobacterales bacterium]
MIEPRRLMRGLAGAGALLVVAGAGATASPSPANATVDPPSVRIFSTEKKVAVQSFRRRRVLLNNLGLYVAPTGGELRIDVTRPSYQGRRAVQLDGETGAELRELPGAADEWRGLDRFLAVEVRKAGKPGSRPVARAARTFCPNAGLRERIDDTGPVLPRYPVGCGRRFPFLRGMAWGIDSGWAVRPRLGGVRVGPGHYRVTVRIAKRYRDLLAIPAADGEVAIGLRVRRARKRGGRRGPSPVPVPVGRRAAEPAATPLSAPVLDDPDPATLPDLEALPLWDVRTRRRGRRDLIGFASSPWNAGPAPLVIEGYRRPGEAVMDAFQYFFDPGGEVVGKAPAGSMHFHRARGHDHWHFEQFARFSLVKPGGATVRSRKQSFCIVPTDPVDLTVLGAEWFPSIGSSCGDPGSIWIREKLPVGWADTYYQSVAGQAFDITKVPNGRYLLRLEVNPRGEINEASTANNVVDRVVRLRGKRGARKVRVKPWNGISP